MNDHRLRKRTLKSTSLTSVRTYQLAAIVVVFVGGFARAETQPDWPSWRGPQGNGSTESGTYPVEWDADHVLWKAPLPGKGCSTPVVWSRRIYLTAPADGLDAVLALDWSGKRLWQTTFGAETPGKHRNGSGSNPSPVTDGKSVFVYFKSGTLASLTIDGKVRWQTNLVERFGPVALFWDHGTSPVLTDDCVVMVRMHPGESWLAAFDKATGEMRWKVARNYKTPVEGDHGYSTPLVIGHGSQQALLVWGGQHLTAHGATDGKVLWSCGGFNPDSKALWPAVASPVVVDDVAVFSFGRNDRGDPRLHGVRTGGSGDVTATHRIWTRRDTGAFVTTPAAYRGRVYLVRDRGQIECIAPATGKTLWSDALPKHRSSFYASPLIADGRLYAAREDGVVFVAKIEGGFELLAENDMQEPVIASPVAVSNRLLIRGQRHLFCVESP
ncbi:MAG: PQQ-binding-like beta-propeller repeat protein [Candidatus Nealsonbacteria bacterium]|nr:PQQ-binding-like beta-propeller repeat protein [Candidatus Nealsonbacteria bacterium]